MSTEYDNKDRMMDEDVKDLKEHVQHLENGPSSTADAEVPYPETLKNMLEAPTREMLQQGYDLVKEDSKLKRELTWQTVPPYCRHDADISTCANSWSFAQERVEAGLGLFAVLAFEVRVCASISGNSEPAKLNLFIDMRHSLGTGFDNGATGITAAM
jgi:hypothetical protein